MPKGTKVERLYEILKKQGKSKGSAARIAQSATGLSLATGKKPMQKRTQKRNMLREMVDKER